MHDLAEYGFEFRFAAGQRLHGRVLPVGDVYALPLLQPNAYEDSDCLAHADTHFVNYAHFVEKPHRNAHGITHAHDDAKQLKDPRFYKFIDAHSIVLTQGEGHVRSSAAPASVGLR